MSEAWGPSAAGRIGGITLTRHGDSVKVHHADPVIRLSKYLFDRLDEIGSITVDGDLLTIHGTNRTVIYRIGEWDEQTESCLCRWPD